MAVELGDLNFRVNVGTQSLESAKKSLSNFASSTDSVTTKLRSLSNQTKAAFNRQEKAIRAAREQVLNLNAAIRRSGGDPRLIANNVNAYKALSRAMKSGTLDARNFGRAQDRFRASLGNTRRSLANFKKVVGDQKEAAAADRMRNLSSRMTDLSKSVQVALGPLSGVASRLTAITALANRNTAAIAAMIGVFIGLGAVIGQAVKVGTAFETEMLTIENRVKATGQAAGFTADQLNELSRALGEDTLASASGARKAMLALMTTVNLSGENFKDALKLSQDLASTGFGTLERNAQRLARVMEDPIGSVETLKRVSVLLNEEQKNLIRAFVNTGQRAKAQRLILDELAKVVGGNAKNAAQGLAGAWDTLGERMNQFFEAVAESEGPLGTLTDTITAVSDKLKDLIAEGTAVQALAGVMNASFSSMSAVVIFLVENLETIIVTIGTFVGARILVRLISLVGKAVVAIKAMSGAMGILNAVILANPLARLLTIILTVGAGILAATNNLDGFINAIKRLVGLQEELSVDEAKRTLLSVGDAKERLQIIDTEIKKLRDQKKIMEDLAKTPAGRLSGSRNPGRSEQREIDKLLEARKIVSDRLKELQDATRKPLEIVVTGGRDATPSLPDELIKNLDSAETKAIAAANAFRIMAGEFTPLSNEAIIASTGLDELLHKTDQLGEQADKSSKEFRDKLLKNIRETIKLSKQTEGFEKLAQIIKETRTPLEKFKDGLEELEELRGFAEQNLQGKELEKTLKALKKAEAELREEYVKSHPILDRLSEAFDDLADQLASAITDSENALENFRGFLKSLVDDILAEFLRLQLINPIMNAIFGFERDTTSSSGGILGGLFSVLGSIFTGGGITAGAPPGAAAPIIPVTTAPLPTAAFGANFTVGGSGGTDSQLVSFMASPGERVDVSQSGLPSGGGPTNQFIVDMRGASVEAVQRLERLVMQVNGSIEQRAISAVTNTRQDNPDLFR